MTNKVLIYFLLLFSSSILKAQLPIETSVRFSNGQGGNAGISIFRAWIPTEQEVPQLKAIFFITNRSPMCTYIAAEDTVFRRAAIELGYGILLADGPIIIDWQTGRAWSDSLVAGLARVGLQVGRPEVQNLPLLVFGHSLGTYFSRGISYDFSERILGAIHFKLGNGLVPTWANSTQIEAFSQIPYAWVNAELEGPDINQGNGVFLAEGGRSTILNERSTLDVPAHQIIEYNGNHNTIPARLAQLLVKFVKACIELRIPSGTDFRNGPVTLIPVIRDQGYLGTLQGTTNFDASSVNIEPYNSSSASSAFYLLSQSYAEAWKQFHTAPFKAEFVSNNRTFCVGESNVNIRLLVGSGVTFGPNNVFRVQLSSVTANFESGSFYPVNIGYLRSSDPSATIPVFIPENLHATGAASPLMPNNSNAQGVYRYTIRVVSTEPELESHHTGFFEISPSPNCPEAELFLRFSPFASNSSQVYEGISYCAGRDTSFSLTILKRTTGPNFSGTNEFRIELSDSSGDFQNPEVLATKTSTLPTGSNGNTWFRDTVQVRFPSTISAGLNYRLRVVSSEPEIVGTTAGMVVHVKDCTLTSLPSLNQTNSKTLVIYPNPTQGFVKLTENQLGEIIKVFNTQGRIVATQKLFDSELLDLTNLNAGVYYIEAGGLRGKVIKQ